MSIAEKIILVFMGVMSLVAWWIKRTQEKNAPLGLVPAMMRDPDVGLPPPPPPPPPAPAPAFTHTQHYLPKPIEIVVIPFRFNDERARIVEHFDSQVGVGESLAPDPDIARIKAMFDKRRTAAAEAILAETRDVEGKREADGQLQGSGGEGAGPFAEDRASEEGQSGTARHDATAHVGPHGAQGNPA